MRGCQTFQQKKSLAALPLQNQNLRRLSEPFPQGRRRFKLEEVFCYGHPVLFSYNRQLPKGKDDLHQKELMTSMLSRDTEQGQQIPRGMRGGQKWQGAGVNKNAQAQCPRGMRAGQDMSGGNTECWKRWYIATAILPENESSLPALTYKRSHPTHFSSAPKCQSAGLGGAKPFHFKVKVLLCCVTTFIFIVKVLL